LTAQTFKSQFAYMAIQNTNDTIVLMNTQHIHVYMKYETSILQ